MIEFIAQKMKFTIKDFSSSCEHCLANFTYSRICSGLPKKSLNIFAMIVCNFEKIEKIFFFFVLEGRYGNYSFISHLFETFKKKILFFSEKWHVSVDEYLQIYSEQLTLCKLYFAWNYRENVSYVFGVLVTQYWKMP